MGNQTLRSNVETRHRGHRGGAKRDGLELKALSWQTAAGLIGQLVWVFGWCSTSRCWSCFLVALVIIKQCDGDGDIGAGA